MVSTYEKKTRSLFSSSRKKIPLRWKNPPWIPEHLSKSNFSKLIKLEKARIPSAVIASHFLKLNDVKFERPTEQGYNDYPRWPTKNPIFRNVKLVQKIIQVMMVETEVTSDKDKVVWFCFFFFFFLISKENFIQSHKKESTKYTAGDQNNQTRKLQASIKS